MSTNSTAQAVSNESSNLKHFFFDENLATAITTGLQEGLNEMCRMPCDFESAFVAQLWYPTGHATAAIELVSENQTALLMLHFADVAILTILSKLVGRTPTSVNDEALDCAGSLLDIVYGRMRAILNPMGYNFKMALPKTKYTAKIIQPDGELRHLIIPFRVASSNCFVQVLVVPNSR